MLSFLRTIPLLGGPLALVLTLSTSTSAFAQTAPLPDAREGIPERITRAEALKKAGEGFDRVDVNRDGVVTRDEILAYQTLLREARLKEANAAPIRKQ